MRLLILVFLFFGGTFLEASMDGFSQRARQAYEEEDYGQAKLFYLDALKLSPDNVDLFYNLGTVSFRNDELGESIYWFLKANRIDPFKDDLVKNLSIARSKVVQSSVSEFSFISIVLKWTIQRFSLLNWLWISFCWGLLLCLSLFIKSSRFVFKPIVFCVFITMLVCSAGRYYLDHLPVAVVVSSKINLRSGPSETVKRVGFLHEGVEVLVQSEYDEWREVRLLNGVSGWVKEHSIKEL